MSVRRRNKRGPRRWGKSWKPEDGHKDMGRSDDPLCSLCPTTKQNYGKTSFVPLQHRILFDAEGRQILKNRGRKR